MKYRVIVSSLNIRSAPDIVKGRVLGTLRKNAEFVASALTSDSKWAYSEPGWICIYDALRKYCELVPEPALPPSPIVIVDAWQAEVEKRLKRLEDFAGF